LVIERIAVAGGPEERSLESKPVAIKRQFGGSHLRVDVRLPARDLIVCVVTDRLIKRVRDVVAPDVSFTRPAKVGSLDPVRHDVADECRAHQKIILIEVTAWPVV